MRKQDAPLLSFVRDGHEQKLLLWKNEREQLERWQRLEQSRQFGNDEIIAIQVATEASNESDKTQVDHQPKVNFECHVIFKLYRYFVHHCFLT